MRSSVVLLLALALPSGVMGALVESNLPVVVLRTLTPMLTCCTDGTDGTMDCCAAKSCGMEQCIDIKEVDINGTMTIYVNGTLSGDVEFYNASFSVHGQSTATVFPKQAYNVNPVKSLGGLDDKDVKVLGLPKDHKWMFKAPYADQTLIRDRTVFEIARSMGRYASRTKLVELYVAPMGIEVGQLDFWPHYKGVMVLEEKAVRDKDRVDISKDDSDNHDPSETGWILSVDKHPDPKDIVIYTTRRTNMQVEYPKIYKEDKYNTSQTAAAADFVFNFMDAFENTLFSDNFLDPVTGYQAHIDMDSFVDYFIITELSTSVDAYRYSTMMSKDSCAKEPDDCKLKMGPAWDYDLSMGSCGNGYMADYMVCTVDYWRFEYEVKFQFKHYDPPANRPEGPNTAQWYARLLSDPAFVHRLRLRWRKLRADTLTDQYILNLVTDAKELLEQGGAADRNFQRWGTLGQSWVWPYRDAPQNPYRPQPQPTTFGGEVAWLLDWLQRRIAWLDGAIERPIYHSFTEVGTTCDVRGSVQEALEGLDCAPGCDYDQLDPLKPDCFRKLDECQRNWADGMDDGPYGSFAAAGVVNGSMCEFLSYVAAVKPDKCPFPPPPTALYCAEGFCSLTKDPPPTAPPPTTASPTPPTPAPTPPTTTTTPAPTPTEPTRPPTTGPSGPSTPSHAPTLQPTYPEPTVPSSPSLSPHSSQVPSVAPSANGTEAPTAAAASSKRSGGATTPIIVVVVLLFLGGVAAAVFCFIRSKKRQSTNRMKFGLLQVDEAEYHSPVPHSQDPR